IDAYRRNKRGCPVSKWIWSIEPNFQARGARCGPGGDKVCFPSPSKSANRVRVVTVPKVVSVETASPAGFWKLTTDAQPTEPGTISIGEKVGDPPWLMFFAQRRPAVPSGEEPPHTRSGRPSPSRSIHAATSGTVQPLSGWQPPI